MQATFPDHAPRRVKEWSPIDRMLANKRCSSSKRSSTTMEQLPATPQQQLNSSKPSVSVGCQSTSWNAIVSEVVATEKLKIQALQAELKSVRNRINERDQAVLAAEANAASHAEAKEALAAELGQVKNSLEELHAAKKADEAVWEEERKAWEVERQNMQQQILLASSAGERNNDNLEYLRAELQRSKDEAATANKKTNALKEAYDALSKEKAALSNEKDHLLERLEVEQAEMMARVDALQERMSQKHDKPR